MSDSEAFETICDRMEDETSFSRLEARGTVRLALKKAGLDPSDVTPAQLAVVVVRILPGELSSRGVEGGEELCQRWQRHLATLSSSESADTPEAVFARLGGGAGGS